MPVKNFNAAP